MVAYGRVQGVFFRDTCRREARRRGVAGWVTNRPDGAVEAVFEGEPADVQALVQWAGQGPPQARVVRVDVADEPPQGVAGFRVV